MSKKPFPWKPLALALLLLVTFDALAFLLPFRRYGSFWVGYASISLALLILITVVLLALGGQRPIKSKFLGLPLLAVAGYYVCAQAVWGLVCMLFPGMPLWLSLVGSILILAAGLFFLLLVETGAQEVRSVGRVAEAKRDHLQLLHTDVTLLAQRAEDAALKNQLEDLAQRLRFSDPISAPELQDVEDSLTRKLASLKQSVLAAQTDDARQLATEAGLLLEERNAKCRLLK